MTTNDNSFDQAYPQPVGEDPSTASGYGYGKSAANQSQPSYAPAVPPQSGVLNAGYNAQQPPLNAAAFPAGANVNQKSQIVAILLAIFFGSIGLHNFYLGHVLRGIIQILLTGLGWLTSVIVIGFFILGAVGLWIFIEVILLAFGRGSYGKDARGLPLK